jgi:protein-tyrosine-phosphatase
MDRKIYRVLFLCTGNSARSIMAECALNRLGRERFRAFSAGSHPKGVIHPMTLDLLKSLDYNTAGLRSKSWDEFARADSPKLDCIITVCDNAAGEVCPIWPGRPITAHWGVADPATFVGSEEATRRFFFRIYRELENRIKLFTRLRIETLERFALESRVKEIGKSTIPD